MFQTQQKLIGYSHCYFCNLWWRVIVQQSCLVLLSHACFVLDCPSTVTEKGYCCVFPFKYKGKTYDSCTFVDGSKPWCALTSDYDTDKKWGYCPKKSKLMQILLQLFCSIGTAIKKVYSLMLMLNIKNRSLIEKYANII